MEVKQIEGINYIKAIDFMNYVNAGSKGRLKLKEKQFIAWVKMQT